MDPVVVATPEAVFTPLFYPCVDGRPKSQYCIQVLKNGKAYSEVINLACNTLTNTTSCADYSSYQVPQLHWYDSKLWMLWWVAMPSQGKSAVLVATIEDGADMISFPSSEDADLRAWSGRAMQMMPHGWDYNYLGGCIGHSAHLFVTGWLQNGTHGSLGVLSFDLAAMASYVNSTKLAKAAMPTIVGPQYSTAGNSSGMLSPLYSMCVTVPVGDHGRQQQQLHIMTTLDNSIPCAGHVYTAYKEVVYYVGTAVRTGNSTVFSPFSVRWRNATSDNDSSCLYKNARFGTDLVAVSSNDGRVFASFRASSQMLSSSYQQRWPLVEVSVSSPAAYQVVSTDVSHWFQPLVTGSQLRSVTVTAMDTHPARKLLFAIIGSAIAPHNFVVIVFTQDFRHFSTPFKLDAPYGVGDTVHVNQPDKNGGAMPRTNLFVWWGGRVAGDTTAPKKNDFLRFRLANVSVQ